MRRMLTILGRGAIDVCRSPLLIAGALIVTLAAAAPFALIVGNQLQEALANQPPIALGSGEIDADWWSEYRVHAEGLAATFTPTVIGFAAPLDNLSAILDGTHRPPVLIVPVVTAAIVWAWFWGVVLTRLHARGPYRHALAAGFRHLPRFVVISAAAAAAQLVLYLTVHPLLFTVIAERVITSGFSEPAAFAVRVVFYGVFVTLIATVSLAADYTRIAQVADRPDSVRTLLGQGVGFVARHFAAVIGLCALIGLLLAILLTGYGALDIYGGSRVGGWRGVALAQLYIIARLIIRLTNAAAELRLFAAVRS